ncbi:hypothetical protein [Deinococcus pimensis]|uniref:hypothetical protein n=1 Tax=Deinococcus pimensis TaxID=309888 RepID=UPI00047F608B|nr:hypothetical protein [Deinococcus pimensis]
MRGRSDDAHPGRAQLLALLGLMFVLIAGPAVAMWVRGDFSRFAAQLPSLALTFMLFRALLGGAWWARQVTVALAFVGGMIAAVLGMLASAATLWGYAVFAVGFVFILCGFGIIGLPAVDAYLEGRRGRRA